jgi:pimeloyl-ACP methyl ester carboxylesterase
MADWPLDVGALADALGLDRFIVAGHSSGGPYAVACAALLPERVSAGLIFSGVTDMQWPGAWEGYIETEKQLMRTDNEEKAVAWCIERFGEDGSGFFAAIDFKLSQPDEAFFADQQIAAALGPGRSGAEPRAPAGRCSRARCSCGLKGDVERAPRFFVHPRTTPGPRDENRDPDGMFCGRLRPNGRASRARGTASRRAPASNS